MSTINPLSTTGAVVDGDGRPTVEFKLFQVQLLAFTGGIRGATYTQPTDAATITWDVDKAPSRSSSWAATARSPTR